MIACNPHLTTNGASCSCGRSAVVSCDRHGYWCDASACITTACDAAFALWDEHNPTLQHLELLSLLTGEEAALSLREGDYLMVLPIDSASRATEMCIARVIGRNAEGNFCLEKYSHAHPVWTPASLADIRPAYVPVTKEDGEKYLSGMTWEQIVMKS